MQSKSSQFSVVQFGPHDFRMDFDQCTRRTTSEQHPARIVEAERVVDRGKSTKND
jgi:hypothetical protein